MALKTDRSTLPKGDMREGIVPDQDSPLVADLLEGLDRYINEWRAKEYGEMEAGERPMSRPDAVFRHSDAAGCARQLAYKMAKAEVTNENGIIDRANMHVGTLLHEVMDDALRAMGYPDEAFEVDCGFDEPVRTAGHADLFHDGVCGEYKSVTGSKFKGAVGERGLAQGPDWSAIVQGALNAVALNAREMVVIDWGKEVISKGKARAKGIPDNDRGLAGWHFTRETLIDAPGGRKLTFPEIAARELVRVHRVDELTVTSEGVDPTRVPRMIDDPEIPAKATIADPMSGLVQDEAGEPIFNKRGPLVYWRCADYCAWRDRCAADMAAGC